MLQISRSRAQRTVVQVGHEVAQRIRAANGQRYRFSPAAAIGSPERAVDQSLEPYAEWSGLDLLELVSDAGEPAQVVASSSRIAASHMAYGRSCAQGLLFPPKEWETRAEGLVNAS